MRWIFLSPHLDDAVLSCGGLIWRLVQSGHPVEIWNLFAGDPPQNVPLSPYAQMHHERWKTGREAVAVRREEDRRACARLGAATRYWVEPDCLYRLLPDGNYLVKGRDDLFTSLHPLEKPLVKRLITWLTENLAGLEDGVCMVVPLTLGGHVDHRAAREGAEGLGIPLRYYPDYPYAVIDQAEVKDWIQPGWSEEHYPVSEAGLEQWQVAVAEYTSQISTFWSGEEHMRQELRNYWAKGGGSRLWRSVGALADARGIPDSV